MIADYLTGLLQIGDRDVIIQVIRRFDRMTGTWNRCAVHLPGSAGSTLLQRTVKRRALKDRLRVRWRSAAYRWDRDNSCWRAVVESGLTRYGFCLQGACVARACRVRQAHLGFPAEVIHRVRGDDVVKIRVALHVYFLQRAAQTIKVGDLLDHIAGGRIAGFRAEW